MVCLKFEIVVFMLKFCTKVGLVFSFVYHIQITRCIFKLMSCILLERIISVPMGRIIDNVAYKVCVYTIYKLRVVGR